MEKTPENNANSQTIKFLLRQFIGRHAIPVESLSQFSGFDSAGRSILSVRAIYSHLSIEGSLPNAVHMASYMHTLGPQFTNRYLALFSQAGAVHALPQAVSPFTHLSGEAIMTAELAAALDDGVLSHSERLALIPLAESRALENTRFAAALRENMVG